MEAWCVALAGHLPSLTKLIYSALMLRVLGPRSSSRREKYSRMYFRNQSTHVVRATISDDGLSAKKFGTVNGILVIA